MGLTDDFPSMNRFEVAFKARVNEEIERLKEVLATGLSITNFAEYCNITGRIYALRSIEEFCEDVRRELDEK